MKSAPLLFAGSLIWISALPAMADSAEQASIAAHQQYLTAVLVDFEQQPDQAISDLRQRLSDFPRWHRGRLELARLYFRHGNFQAARSNVKQVVQEVALPGQVKRNVLAFYRQILEAERRTILEPSKPKAPTADIASQPPQPKGWQLSGRLGFALGYDSNANTGPEDQDIGLNNLILRPEALEQSDHYRSLQLALRADREVSIDGENKHSLQWRNRLYLFDRNYRQQARADLGSYRLYSGLSWRVSPNWRVATRLRLQQLRYDINARINQVGLEPSLTWTDGAHRVRTHLLASQRRYRGEASRTKNGDLQELGIRYGYRFNSHWQGQVGGRWIETNYRSDRYSYNAWEAEGQLNYRPSRDLMVWGQLRYRSSDYKGAEKPYYDDARDEQYLTTRVGARYYVAPDLSLDLVLSGYRNQANHKLHDYNRKQAELRLSWMF